MSAATREAVVAEALTWQGTPYHHAARVRGAGVDCANLLVGIYRNTGLLPDLDLGHYPRDWHLHRSGERFLGWLERLGERIESPGLPEPGDVAVFRYGRCVSHGALVLAWPTVLHAWMRAGYVLQADAAKEPLAGRLHSFWRIRGL